MGNRTRTSLVRKADTKHSVTAQYQLYRLLCVFALFLVVFLGKRIFPEKIVSIGGEVMAVLNQTTDFERVFAELGDALAGSDGPIQSMEDFCMEVFGPRKAFAEHQEESAAPAKPPSPVGLLSEQLASAELFVDFLPRPDEVSANGDDIASTSENVVPAVGRVMRTGEDTEQPLPEGYTADELSLGGLPNVSPVLGVLTSPYGYRDHPLNGKFLFHGGVDISADPGDPIAAFADGRVEYVGEDDSYGLYFQLDHGAGIKSFYAHCNSVCVKKGQRVLAGECVAQVGSSGTATGPHLHLELKCGNLRVNPAYYIEFLEA